jgi:putative ABC transport system permease protein
MIKTRWHKIINDIKGNKSRSLLVVLSIAVGIGVVGIINNAKIMIEDDLYSQYDQGNPASVHLYTSPFQESLLDKVLEIEEVESVEARRLTGAAILDENAEAVEVSLITLAQFDNIQVNQPTLEDGSWSLGDDEIALEEQSADALEVAIGDQITLEMEDGSQHQLVISAIVNNIYEMPYSITNQLTAFISMDTLEVLGEMP